MQKTSTRGSIPLTWRHLNSKSRSQKYKTWIRETLLSKLDFDMINRLRRQTAAVSIAAAGKFQKKAYFGVDSNQ